MVPSSLSHQNAAAFETKSENLSSNIIGRKQTPLDLQSHEELLIKCHWWTHLPDHHHFPPLISSVEPKPILFISLLQYRLDKSVNLPKASVLKFKNHRLNWSGKWLAQTQLFTYWKCNISKSGSLMKIYRQTESWVYAYHHLLVS